MPPRPMALNHRARTILAAVIEDFIASGEPVSSRSVAKRDGLDLSPATIRTVMAELEEAGLLAQPALQADPAKTLSYAVWQHGAAADTLQARRTNWTIEDLATEIGNVRP